VLRLSRFRSIPEEIHVPRKPQLKKTTITVLIEQTPITVTLHPPTGARKSWFVYWNGLVSSKSTGQAKLEDAVVVAESMLRRSLAGGSATQPVLDDLVMSDEEFIALQREHFNRKKDPDAQRRSAKSLKDCLLAIGAFKEISGLDRIVSATPADCGRFQKDALTKTRNWRHHHARAGCQELLSPNTVLKWSRQMMAAFDRANRNAGKKCVRGIVPDEKLLEYNPWSRFAWLVEGVERPVRQFDADELLSLLTFIETEWSGVPAGAAAIKTLLWSSLRREELARLKWSDVRLVKNEFHFEVIGKRGVRRWFRLPVQLYRELESMRCDSPFVFAGYPVQLERFHADRPNFHQNVRLEYKPPNLEQWLYRRVKSWATTNPKGDAYVHIFRKTGLQHAREGEDITREVAADAGVSASVLTTHYVTQSDIQLLSGSNRMYRRILASLPVEVARRYGHEASAASGLEEQLQVAVEAKNWELAQEISGRLAKDRRSAAG
jgi:integrase